VEPETAAERIFSLTDACQMLPAVKAFTAEAVRQVERLASRLQAVPDTDPQHDELNAEIADVVNQWADTVREAGLEAKGLWLVDFDNGEGYYCWCYPEETVGHFHDYDDGFAGRVKIV
jgi:hypothetical protein